VAYIEDIDFLPNPSLDKTGSLMPSANPSQQRGEALFRKPFPHDSSMSCAGCHVPSAAFVDHRQHDIGSGGLYKTPTLVNADFSAPYFHDGRFDNYAQVIDHFNRVYDLALNAQDRADIAAYLTVIGDGVRPEYHLTGTNVLEDIDGFAGVLDIAISSHDIQVVAFAVRSVSDLLQDLAERYPDPKNQAISGGVQERSLARAMIAALRQILLRVDRDVAGGRFDQAAAEYLAYRKLTFAAAPLALQAAEPWSLFTPALHDARRAGMSRTTDASIASD
jgi:hypothetical protein